ncbi:MAG: hypothetical protein LBD60_03195 [Puniceicoccales bacterium]|jgi:hypothetical protein|nr:hypothetical protein [Puniceicoccales bacterium]
MLNMLLRVLLLIFLSKSYTFVFGTQLSQLPPRVVLTGAPLTPKQLAYRQRRVQDWEKAKDQPLVRAARGGNFRAVRYTCEHTPKGRTPAYFYHAFREAVYGRHDDITTYLAFQQPQGGRTTPVAIGSFGGLYGTESDVFLIFL